MQQMNRIFSAVVLMFLILVSCRREFNNLSPQPNPSTQSTKDLIVPAGFNYETTREVEVDLSLLDNADQPFAHAVVWLSDMPLTKGGQQFLKASTDLNGNLKAKITIPSTLSELVINTTHFGIPRNIVLPLLGKTLKHTLGGKDYKSGKTMLSHDAPMQSSLPLGKLPGKFSTRLGTWNSSTGKPNYLEPSNDVVSSGFLSQVQSVLPEQSNLGTVRPTFLNDDIYRRNILLTATADIYVTFVTEGADYRNLLFYYVYNRFTPPSTVSDIDSFIVVFPNTSFSGSGGDLVAGNKVRIGRYGADTVIAFGILANGFQSGSIDNSKPLFFGNKALNPETTTATPNLKQHLAMVYDNTTERYILGFEDINRDPGNGCDHDFNDAVFYATTNPVSSVNTDNLPGLPSVTDTDNDGIDDTNDDYPSDANKAFNNYYPGSNTVSSVAFEDLWYYQGDYDMNDLVVDVRTNCITNASNNVVRFEGSYWVRATGGSLNHAFCVQYPFTRTNVSSLSGGTLESGQTNAIVQLFTNDHTYMQWWNTYTTDPTSDSVLFQVSFNLSTPPSLSSVGLSIYDPFIWINNTDKGRGWEIHIAGKPPTSSATTSLFGQGDDDTQLSGVKKYLSHTNLPWAIEIPERFDYPKEKEDISATYTYFATWAQSGGSSSRDWYKNLTGYRNALKLYIQ